MQYLINTCDPKENDKIFCMNSLNYGDVAACLRPVLLLINKFNLDYSELKNFNNLSTLVFNSIKLDYLEIINEDTLPLISKNAEVLISLAISQNSEKCLEKMLKNNHFKKKVNCFNKEHGTHLDNACSYGNSEIVSILLLSGADPTISNNLGHFPIYTAALRGHSKVVQLLANHPLDTINKFNSFGQTPLLMACEARSENAVNLLLDYGADINLADLYGYTPLLFACRELNSKIVELLVKRGADVNQCNKYGDRPLSVAASYGLSSSVETLIHAKAIINAVNIKGNSPLHGCCWNKHVACLRKLIDAGADVNVSNKFGFTPLHMCVRYQFEAGIEILLEAGANQNIKNKYGETFEEMSKRYQATLYK